ncbi:MAG: hypothetical protein LBJ62_11000 [Bifidobacteriaceae bacterium]|nr:hypothetical protein [Bifidobacteriaceae bacterium]
MAYQPFPGFAEWAPRFDGSVVELKAADLARLVDELNSAEFADGNGRVARALASVYLYRDPGVPLVIFADQRDLYIDALEAAGQRWPGAFAQFIADRVVDTIGLVIDESDGTTSPLTSSFAT